MSCIPSAIIEVLAHPLKTPSVAMSSIHPLPARLVGAPLALHLPFLERHDTTRHTTLGHLPAALSCLSRAIFLARSRSSTRYSSLPSHSLSPICGAQANPLCQRASYRLDQTSIHPAISSLISSVSLLPVSPALIRPCMRLLMDMARETATALRPSTPMAPLHRPITPTNNSSSSNTSNNSWANLSST